jgi:ferrous iron transport protein A
MDAFAAPSGLALDPAYVSLSALSPGARGTVVGVGRSGTPAATAPAAEAPPSNALSPLERRLLELGFVNGEQFEIVAEARPGRDPFVVRIGTTTFALRRREAESVWVELTRPGNAP